MLIIRKAAIEDGEAVYEVEKDCFSVPWSMESILSDLEDEERALYLVVEKDDEVIGYGGAWLVADEGQITNIAIKRAYRRQGFGAMMTRKLVKEIFKAGMNEIFLEVRTSNMPALSLYRRLGFTVKGVRKAYYIDPVEDAYIMSLQKEEPEE